jgi:hypothetical protein
MELSKMKIMITALMALSLTACASVTPERVTLAYSKCPVLKQYTEEQLKKAASEMKQLPSESQIASMITDYGKLREACRIATQVLSKQ